MKWNTSTRHKILCIVLIFIACCVVFILKQWAKGTQGAEGILKVFIGVGGLAQIIVGALITWEKVKRKGGVEDKKDI